MLKIEAKNRNVFGKKVRSLLKQGLIPAEVYGHGFENLHVSLPAKEFVKVFNQVGESSLINIDLEGNIFPVLIHDIQKDSLSDRIVHVDLYRVRMDEKIKTTVPLRFVGEAPAVKKGGILVKSVEEVEVEALPSDLPHELEVDLSKLVEIHQSLHGSDIKVPSGVKINIDQNMAIATVVELEKEEVAETIQSAQQPTEESQKTQSPLESEQK
jgi:large subunit ribosomal protein L25